MTVRGMDGHDAVSGSGTAGSDAAGRRTADDPVTAAGGAGGGATRALILDVALASFRERGYDRTTMRGIAQSAHVSLGNAYYYFDSKEVLVQEFYATIQDGHRRRAAEALQHAAFADRLRGVLHAGIDEMAPYHAFAGSFIKTAILPSSPASPFSGESTAAREAAIGLFREVVEGAAGGISEALARDLPELLWLTYLGITLFWVGDRSPDQIRTRRLVDTTTRLISRLLPLSRLPGLRSVTADIHALLVEMRQPMPQATQATQRRGSRAR
ncbi:TetR family transcriptional regulator [Frankia sp. AgPm24]|uniref:TetR family transcriptional regulator n=1 Tax=Frankia sp. AgPm24 TaxID=631128 RepID=UPI00200ED78F|nr:TetR family transcriptional regulator [Frankia sp. AgPm24]MCK9924490.1 TetR family transcriptional regulator [Frankia sp. AgPm24]